MATAEGDPGDEIGSFDQSYFSPEEISDKLIWPAVDEFYRGDWREEAGPGDRLKLTKRAVHGGRLTIVTLEAECMFEEGDEDGSIYTDDPPSNTATLEIARSETEFMRDLLFKNIPEERYDSVMGDIDEEIIQARNITSYFFVDEDLELVDSGVSGSNVLVDPNHDFKWLLVLQGQADVAEDAERDDRLSVIELAETMKFREHDLDEMAFILALLTGSGRYDPVIQDIKLHPIKEH